MTTRTLVIVVVATLALTLAASSDAQARPNESGSFVTAGMFLCQFTFSGCMIESDGLGMVWVYWPTGGMATYWWVDADGDGLGYYQSANGSTLDFDRDGNDPNHVQDSGRCNRTGPNPPRPNSIGRY